MRSRDLLTRARRLLALVVPLLVFVALVVVGLRVGPPRATDEAFGATPDAAVPLASDAPASDPVEAATSPPDGAPVEAPRSAVETTIDGGFVLDLNLADEDDLVRLPGIGPTRARAIVALRTKLGRFKSVDDLARVRGIGRATLRKLRPHVRIGTP